MNPLCLILEDFPMTNFLVALGCLFLGIVITHFIRERMQPRHLRILFKIERNMMNLEDAANSGNWQLASQFAALQEQLLADYYRCNESSDHSLESHLMSNTRLRSPRDDGYIKWMRDELFKRGLQPNQ